MHSTTREKAIKNKTNSSLPNHTDQCKCSSLIDVLATKLELLSKALTDANTKNAAIRTKVDKELSSLNDYLALSTPCLLAAKKVIQLSDAAIKTATASLVDRRVRESRLIIWGSFSRKVTPTKQAQSLLGSVLSKPDHESLHADWLRQKGQRAATKMVAGLKSMDYETRLVVLDLFPLEYRRLRGDLILTYALFEQGLANRFFTVDPANTRRGHGERQLLNDKNKTDPGNLGKSLAPVYQSVNPCGYLELLNDKNTAERQEQNRPGKLGRKPRSFVSIRESVGQLCENRRDCMRFGYAVIRANRSLSPKNGRCLPIHSNHTLRRRLLSPPLNDLWTHFSSFKGRFQANDHCFAASTSIWRALALEPQDFKSSSKSGHGFVRTSDGFRKVNRIDPCPALKMDVEDMEFRHPFFVRQKPHLLSKIQRKPTSTLYNGRFFIHPSMTNVNHNQAQSTFANSGEFPQSIPVASEFMRLSGVVRTLRNNQEMIAQQVNFLKSENQLLARFLLDDPSSFQSIKIAPSDELHETPFKLAKVDNSALVTLTNPSLDSSFALEGAGPSTSRTLQYIPSPTLLSVNDLALPDNKLVLSSVPDIDPSSNQSADPVPRKPNNLAVLPLVAADVQQLGPVGSVQQARPNMKCAVAVFWVSQYQMFHGAASLSYIGPSRFPRLDLRNRTGHGMQTMPAVSFIPQPDCLPVLTTGVQRQSLHISIYSFAYEKSNVEHAFRALSVRHGILFNPMTLDISLCSVCKCDSTTTFLGNFLTFQSFQLSRHFEITLCLLSNPKRTFAETDRTLASLTQGLSPPAGTEKANETLAGSENMAFDLNLSRCTTPVSLIQPDSLDIAEFFAARDDNVSDISLEDLFLASTNGADISANSRPSKLTTKVDKTACISPRSGRSSVDSEATLPFEDLSLDNQLRTPVLQSNPPESSNVLRSALTKLDPSLAKPELGTADPAVSVAPVTTTGKLSTQPIDDQIAPAEQRISLLVDSTQSAEEVLQEDGSLAVDDQELFGLPWEEQEVVVEDEEHQLGDNVDQFSTDLLPVSERSNARLKAFSTPREVTIKPTSTLPRAADKFDHNLIIGSEIIPAEAALPFANVPTTIAHFMQPTSIRPVSPTSQPTLSVTSVPTLPRQNHVILSQSQARLVQTTVPKSVTSIPSNQCFVQTTSLCQPVLATPIALPAQLLSLRPLSIGHSTPVYITTPHQSRVPERRQRPTYRAIAPAVKSTTPPTNTNKSTSINK
ncbi:heat shock transcription factor [Clonorchis sinensis]|uniref:Heat shock transcription factor n=1 Tax=Clonorchis sinensis TaxID=79923 RepID=G7YUJ4_CLOSI|nr:heat shock transcription factor [Clonorchis sinensis]